MSRFTPGQFRKSLQEKIREKKEDEEEENVQIIKPPTSFSPRASDYHRKQGQEASDQKSGGTAQLPTESPLNKPVHERMKSFVKEQYGKSS